MGSQGRYLTIREPPREQNELPCQHYVGNQWRGGKAETESLIFCRGEEGERQRQKS